MKSKKLTKLTKNTPPPPHIHQIESKINIRQAFFAIKFKGLLFHEDLLS